jgi:hypothetical protein
MQVWSQNELVGELHVRPQHASGPRVVLEWLDPDSINHFVPGSLDDDMLIPAPTIQRREFEIKKMHFRIEDYQREIMGDQEIHKLLQRYHVPADAESFVNMAVCETIYRWKVLDLTPAQVEEIFDLDMFEPLDFGAPDYERRKTEMPGLGFTV